MSKSRVWRSGLALLSVTSLSLLLSVGCSKQGEGERCDLTKAGQADCDDGLRCVRISDGVERCCPPEGTQIGDSRCQSSGITGSGGKSSSSGGATNVSGGAAGETSTSSGGAVTTNGGAGGEGA
ncbi:MAG: hypothetical protein QM756_11905 [Polyangiaceae bacterium]